MMVYDGGSALVTVCDKIEVLVSDEQDGCTLSVICHLLNRTIGFCGNFVSQGSLSLAVYYNVQYPCHAAFHYKTFWVN